MMTATVNNSVIELTSGTAMAVLPLITSCITERRIYREEDIVRKKMRDAIPCERHSMDHKQQHSH